MSLDKLRLVLQGGHDTLPEYIWGNYGDFITDFITFYKCLDERSSKYFGVECYIFTIYWDNTYPYFLFAILHKKQIGQYYSFKR